MHTINRKIKAFAVVAPSKVDAAKTPPVPPRALPDRDRRIVLKRAHGLAERSLRFNKRPKSKDGFSAWTSDFIATPAGKFAIGISHYINGHTHPFEVWALGREAPTSASEICEILSKVLQTDDPAFIAYHLDALKGAIEFKAPFALTVPHTGETLTVASVGAAIAHVVEAHAKAIGYFASADPASSRMLAAMTSVKEPKTEGQGGTGFFEDVHNPTTGDTFPLLIKEALLPDGSIFPYSLWFCGRRVPAESEAICKLISLALRHSDAAWTAAILGVLRKHAPRTDESHDFWAPQPLTAKRANYRSTWAYVAEVVLARLRDVGRLDADNQPIEQGCLFDPDEDSARASAPTSVGQTCPACHEPTYVRLDGCWTCQSCSHSKCG